LRPEFDRTAKTIREDGFRRILVKRLEVPAMETRFGVPFIDPCVVVIPRVAVESLPAATDRRHNVAPISLSGGVLMVAVEDPLDFELLDKLRVQCGMPVDTVTADPDRIRAVVRWHYGEEPTI
jgi:type IV pilus assembly protein PilB